MRFEWDIEKDRINRAKHDVGFHTAAQVFDDPLALPRFDRIVNAEERWRTVGETHAGSLLVVVHTYRQQDDADIVRIISARKADRYERRAYEGGN